MNATLRPVALVAAVLTLALALLSPRESAAGTTNLTDYANTTGVTTSKVVPLSGIQFPRQNFTFQSGTITNGYFTGSPLTNGVTNCIAKRVQIATTPNDTNWVTVYTWFPNGTNGYLEDVGATFPNQTFYLRVQTTTSNSLPSADFLRQ